MRLSVLRSLTLGLAFQPGSWGRGAWLGYSRHPIEKGCWGIVRYFTYSKRGAGNLGGCSCCCYFHLTVIESQSPNHLSGEPARQGQSLALKADLVPSALMTLDKHQILAISKQNLGAPSPGAPGKHSIAPPGFAPLVLTDCQQSPAEKSPALQPLPAHSPSTSLSLI